MNCRICKKEFLGPDDVVRIEACKFLDPSEDSFEFSTRYDIMEANCVIHLQCFMGLLDEREGLEKVGKTTVDRGVKSTTYGTETGGEVTYVSRTNSESVQRTQALGFFT